MKQKTVLYILSILTLAFAVSAAPAIAQHLAASAQKAQLAPVESGSKAGFDTLVGLWVRPDGGYRIAIQGVDSSGKLDASYANPQRLPFATAEASREGDTVKVFLELRAGGYNGSTYNLSYDPASDILKGVYYQAVARQRFDVYFERAK